MARIQRAPGLHTGARDITHQHHLLAHHNQLERAWKLAAEVNFNFFLPGFPHVWRHSGDHALAALRALLPGHHQVLAEARQLRLLGLRRGRTAQRAADCLRIVKAQVFFLPFGSRGIAAVEIDLVARNTLVVVGRGQHAALIGQELVRRKHAVIRVDNLHRREAFAAVLRGAEIQRLGILVAPPQGIKRIAALLQREVFAAAHRRAFVKQLGAGAQAEGDAPDRVHIERGHLTTDQQRLRLAEKLRRWQLFEQHLLPAARAAWQSRAGGQHAGQRQQGKHSKHPIDQTHEIPLDKVHAGKCRSADFHPQPG